MTIRFIRSLGAIAMLAAAGALLPYRPLTAQSADAAAPVVYAADVDSIIHPVSARYMIDTLAAADRAGAVLVVLTLRTPGGLVDSTRDIITRMIAAATPVVAAAVGGQRSERAIGHAIEHFEGFVVLLGIEQHGRQAQARESAVLVFDGVFDHPGQRCARLIGLAFLELQFRRQHAALLRKRGPRITLLQVTEHPARLLGIARVRRAIEFIERDQSFVAVNTMLFLGLAIAKTLPVPRLPWRGGTRRGETRSIHPDEPA